MNNKRFSINDYRRIVEVMASQPDVKAAVLDSHDDNPWWPLYVKDWRLRMIVSGLSTRVGFRMLGSYKKVVANLTSYSYDEIKAMPDEKLIEIVKPLGLSANRLGFTRSMIEFIDNHHIDINTIDEDELVSLINKHVQGASYKVGSCCVLYAKYYNCGIIPVDSGIKDGLAPCIGLVSRRTAEGHETVRYQFEEIANSTDWKDLAIQTGYSELTLKDDEVLTWWYHLVHINFKRYFCNNKKPQNCPLKADPAIADKIGCMCSKECPEVGGNRLLFVDSSIKSKKQALLKNLEQYGMKMHKKEFLGNMEDLNSLSDKQNIRQSLSSEFFTRFINHISLIDMIDVNDAIKSKLQEISSLGGRLVLITEEVEKATSVAQMYQDICDIQVLNSGLSDLEIFKATLSPLGDKTQTTKKQGVRVLIKR